MWFAARAFRVIDGKEHIMWNFLDAVFEIEVVGI